MKILFQIGIPLLFAATIRPVCAEIGPPLDELSKAYEVAVNEWSAGKEAHVVVDFLAPVLASNPKSHYAGIATPFLQDLAAFAKLPPVGKDEPSERRLADTHMPLYLLSISENWENGLKAYLAKAPEDPASELATAGHSVIARLIPQLGDRTPARCGNMSYQDWNRRQPRVCDFALALIEYHGKVRFSHGITEFHQLPDPEKLAERVVSWWAEVKDKSVTAGVRAQIFQGSSYADTVWMAKSLALLAEEEKSDDWDFALNVLRKMVKDNPRTHMGAHAAGVLAEFGDMSPVDLFYEEWKSWLGKPGLIHDSGIAFYLCKYGGRREWELLHAMSLLEISEGKGPGSGAVWACAVNSGVADTNPYAIPILGLALGETENTGSRSVPGGSQAFSYADKACEMLQKQVGLDFGYSRNGTEGKRLDAIRTAQEWWEKEGKANYTFDHIDNISVKSKQVPLRDER